MRFALYNIRYGTGAHRPLFPWSGYLSRTNGNLQSIIEFLKSLVPDIVGLVEVDAGSWRSDRLNQAGTIANALGHYHAYRSKYDAGHLASRLPLLRQQGNAFLTRDTVKNKKFHYFRKGVKRLVIEMELEDITIFLVHLSITFGARHQQLGDLYDLVKHTRKPHIVAGDFNARWGDREINLFLGATKLVSANPAGAATFPSWAPKRQLDFILHSPDIHPTRFWIPPVTFSDHLPLVCDFEIGG